MQSSQNMPPHNEVIILATGYSRADATDSSAMRANCSCTLIRSRDGKLNIIVDTMTAWDGELIKAALAKHELTPADISIVVCTHGHSDHIGCNYLFTAAKLHFVGSCASQHDKYYLDYFDKSKNHYTMDTFHEIWLECTPGHTLNCISVLVQNTQFGANKIIGICGDLFERAEDINDATIWLEAGSEDETKQREERLRMVQLCAFIVPGHGTIFEVNEEMRLKLKKDVEDACELNK